MKVKKLSTWLVAFGAVALLAAGACKKKDQAATGPADTAAVQTPATAQAGDANAWYRCPMEECHYAQKGPGKCPTCGMDLVKTPDGWAPAPTAPAAAPAAALQIKTAGELAPERVGQTETCQIGGDTFTVTAETPAVAYEGKVHLFGCIGCANAFVANPASPTAPNCPHHGGH